MTKINEFIESRSMYYHSLICFIFVGLFDDPIKEISDIFSSFGKHAYGYHVEHLRGLIEFDVEFIEIKHPEEYQT